MKGSWRETNSLSFDNLAELLAMSYDRNSVQSRFTNHPAASRGTMRESHSIIFLQHKAARYSRFLDVFEMVVCGVERLYCPHRDLVVPRVSVAGSVLRHARRQVFDFAHELSCGSLVHLLLLMRQSLDKRFSASTEFRCLRRRASRAARLLSGTNRVKCLRPFSVAWILS